MIVISPMLKLQSLKTEHQPILRALMKKIYPPVYKHLWKNEDCSWYLDSQYSILPFEKDLNQNTAEYYFLIHLNQPIGILRFIWNCPHENLTTKKALKLHRLYIDPKFHGKGFGKDVFKWLIDKAEVHDCNFIWLEVMDSQEQALEFYKRFGFKKKFAMRLPFTRIHPSLRGMYTMDLNLNETSLG